MPGCWILSLHLLFQLNNNLVKNKIMKKVMLLVLVLYYLYCCLHVIVLNCM